MVITLLYVARQLRQNTASVRSSAYQTWVSVSNAEHTAGQDASIWKENIIAKSIGEKEFDRAARFLAALGPSQWWAAGNARTQFSNEFVEMIEDRTPGELQQYWFTAGQGFHPHSATPD